MLMNQVLSISTTRVRPLQLLAPDVGVLLNHIFTDLHISMKLNSTKHSLSSMKFSAKGTCVDFYKPISKTPSLTVQKPTTFWGARRALFSGSWRRDAGGPRAGGGGRDKARQKVIAQPWHRGLDRE